MDESKDLAIYGLGVPQNPKIAEALGLPLEGRHACLAVVDETLEVPVILKAIHFFPARKGPQFLQMLETQGLKNSWDEVITHRYLAGKREKLLQIWDRAVSIGSRIQDLQLPFSGENDPEAMNCRACVKGVVETLGFEYVPTNEPGDHAGSDTHVAAMLPPEI